MLAGERRHVVLVARSAPALEALAGEIAANGGTATALPLDLAVPGCAERVAAALAERGLHCDILVNNAGFGLRGRAAELDAGEQLEMLDLNVRALADLAVRFLPGMLARGSGGVINVGSTAGYQPGPNMAFYYASKAFVRSLSLALGEEARGSGVTVTLVAPGPVATAFFDRAGIQQAKLFRLLPKLTAEDVAIAGWNAFRRGRRSVVPGLYNRLFAFAAPFIPTSIILPLLGRLQRPKRPAAR